jgi:hypothetical protein
MELLQKIAKRNFYLQIVFSAFGFLFAVILLAKYFEFEYEFAFKIIIVYMALSYLISSVLNWMGFVLFIKEGQVAYFEYIIHQFYENIQDEYMRNLNDTHRNIIELSIEDHGLSPEFRRILTGIWAKMENVGIQQRFMNGIAWRSALQRYALMHPERFSKAEGDGFTFIKGENPRWQGDDFLL